MPEENYGYGGKDASRHETKPMSVSLVRLLSGPITR